MGLLQKLKSTLGLGGSGSRGGPDRTGDVDVRVEHEPAAESEAAVKGTDDGPEPTPAGDESADEGSADEGESTAETESARDAETKSAGAAETEAAGAAETEAAESETTEPESTASAESAEPDSDDAGGAAGVDVSVDELSGIGAAYAERLGDAGIESVGDLADADAESVAEESGIAQGRIEGWIEQAREY